MSDLLDSDGYPRPKTLTRIKQWKAGDSIALMEYVKSVWRYADCGYWQERDEEGCRMYEISTGGWSGNEEIIQAMKANHIFWMVNWLSSRRGGHYVFKVGGLK
jgi:hypothetical protein